MRLIVVMLAVLALASCTTTSTSKVDIALQKNLPKVCDALSTSYIAFAAISATGKLKASTVNKVNAAFQGVQVVCAHPETATLASSVIKVTQAVIVITQALKEAKVND